MTTLGGGGTGAGGDTTGGEITLGGSTVAINESGDRMVDGCSGFALAKSRGIGRGYQLLKSSRSLEIEVSCSW